MPNPKDPEKLAAYREKLRAIALARGYGKWMQGRSLPPQTVAKMREKQIAIGRNPEERERRSQRAKANGTGKWMKGRILPEAVKEKIVAHRRDKTYAEIYGERAEQEASKRRESNRARWNDVPRKTQREKHNADHRYSDWRKAVFERDNYTCCVCGEHASELQAHHIRSWAKHSELRYDVNNGMTVHKGKCHRAADKQTRENEKAWPAPNARNLSRWPACPTRQHTLPEPLKHEDDSGQRDIRPRHIPLYEAGRADSKQAVCAARADLSRLELHARNARLGC